MGYDKEAYIRSHFHGAPHWSDDFPMHYRNAVRIRNVMRASGYKSWGDVRDATDRDLLALTNLARHSVSEIRQFLSVGLHSDDAIRRDNVRDVFRLLHAVVDAIEKVVLR